MGWRLTQLRNTINIFRKKPNTNIDYTKILSQIQDLREKTSGNYDALIGKVKNFSWEALPNGSYVVYVYLISIGDVIDSYRLNNTSFKTDRENNQASILNQDVLTRRLQAIKQIATSKNITGRYSITDDDLSEYDFYFEKQGVIDYRKILIIDQPNNTGKPSQTTSAYISLGTLVTLINDIIVEINEEGGVKLFELSSIGTCLSHPLQISVDPKKFLISSANLADDVFTYDLGLSRILSQNWPYRVDGTPFDGEQSNILINVDHVLNIINGLDISQNQNQVYFTDLVTILLDSFEESTGYINDFALLYEDIVDAFGAFAYSQYRIVDRHHQDSYTDGDYYEMPIFGLKSISKGYRMSSKVTNDIATVVSISAQRPELANANGQNSSYLNFFNQGIEDRIIRQKVPSQNISPFINQQAAELQASIDDIVRNVDSLQDILKWVTLSGTSSFWTESKTTEAKKVLRDVILLINTLDLDLNKAYSSYFPIPIEVNIDIEGVSGLKIGQVFKIQTDRLLIQYKYLSGENLGKSKIGFVLFGIDQKIATSGWQTSLTGKMKMLRERETYKLKDFRVLQEVYNRTKSDLDINFALVSDDNLPAGDIIDVTADPNLTTQF